MSVLFLAEGFLSMKRYHELDSLRGLAEFIVLISHFLLLFNLSWVNHLNKTPLRILKGGHEAVIFFFVLSGFVLSLPFFNDKKEIRYSSYLIKRFFRIYIPYIVTVSVSIIAYLSFYNPGIQSKLNLSQWFFNVWTTPLTTDLIINHIILLGNFKDYALDPVLWSLSQELRISIIFPLLMFFVVKYNWKINILLGILGSIVSILLFNYFTPDQYPVSSNYPITLHYVLMFIMGALLAKYREVLITFFKKQGTKLKFLTLFVGCFIYTYSGFAEEVFFKLFNIRNNWTIILPDLGISIGVCILIIVSLASKRISDILAMKPIVFLGNISYSLYLYHTVILISCIYLLYNVLPIWSVLLIALMLSIIVPTISYYYVELPSIKRGKKIVETIISKKENKVA
jgi:peptidoglycan/LPS O-acetylase OafA/YrhL